MQENVSTSSIYPLWLHINPKTVSRKWPNSDFHSCHHLVPTLKTTTKLRTWLTQKRSANLFHTPLPIYICTQKQYFRKQPNSDFHWHSEEKTTSFGPNLTFTDTIKKYWLLVPSSILNLTDTVKKYLVLSTPSSIYPSQTTMFGKQYTN